MLQDGYDQPNPDLFSIYENLAEATLRSKCDTPLIRTKTKRRTLTH